MRLPTAFSKISKLAYLVAFITFVMRAGHFMSLPFLAIYLTHEGLLSPSQIGLVLGISGLVLSLTGLINGMYVDRNSHKTTLILALFLAGFCYFGFVFSMHLFYVLLLLNGILGWFRSLAEISTIAILVNQTDPKNLSYSYSARFIGANLGVVLGPLIGALMATRHSLYIFYIAGGINIGLGIIMMFSLKKTIKPISDLPKVKLRENFKELFKDKILINITIINFILWSVYAQLDTTIPQFLTHTWKNPATLFCIFMMINAGLCIVFQPFVLRWAELTSLRLAGIVGCCMFAVSFILLAISPTPTMMIISVIIMSLAELFTLPINSLLIMRVAPKHLIASYNGLCSLGLLGISIGPILGGYGLQYLNGQAVFLLAGLLPLVAMWRYLKYVPD